MDGEVERSLVEGGSLLEVFARKRLVGDDDSEKQISKTTTIRKLKSHRKMVTVEA